MKNAKLSVISFNDNDVIATSGGPLQIVLANFGNGIAGDATISAKGKVIFTNSTVLTSADMADEKASAVLSAINAEYGTNISGFPWLSNISMLDDALYSENKKSAVKSNDTASSDLNGTYTYNGASFIKTN